MLSELPRNIIDLRELEVLDISYVLVYARQRGVNEAEPIPSLRHNAFQSLPKSIILLPSLVTLDISHNSLAEVCFLSGERPDQAVLDYRKDNAFLTSFPGTPTRSKFVAEDTDVVLPSLKQMMVQGNKLTNSSLPPVWPENLELVDLSGNALSGQWDVTSLAACRQLKKVVVARNGLTSLIRDDDEEGWRSLESFDLTDNEVRDEDHVAQVFGSRSGFNLVSLFTDLTALMAFD
jgi:Leucine-rich repeat (LRR) protein